MTIDRVTDQNHTDPPFGDKGEADLVRRAEARPAVKALYSGLSSCSSPS
jgi:hypothetical protein